MSRRVSAGRRCCRTWGFVGPHVPIVRRNIKDVRASTHPVSAMGDRPEAVAQHAVHDAKRSDACLCWTEGGCGTPAGRLYPAPSRRSTPLQMVRAGATLASTPRRGQRVRPRGCPRRHREEEAMQRSATRILTTHTGSLPRPAALVQMVEGHDQREVRGYPAFASHVHAAVAEVVHKQADVGIDVLTDGEMSKVAFSAYVTERVTGFDGPLRQPALQIEPRLFPEYFQSLPPVGPGFRACNGPITWQGDAYVQQDIATLQAALQGVSPTEVFLPAVSPGQIWFNFPNEYYPTDEAYIYAVADALKHEYRAIVEAVFLPQLDSPDLAMAWNRAEFADKTFADYRQFVAHHVAAINYALEGIPADRIRVHLCWGNGERPHVRDCPIAEFIDIIYTVHAEALSFEGANPRHAHEWKIFKD